MLIHIFGQIDVKLDKYLDSEKFPHTETGMDVAGTNAGWSNSSGQLPINADDLSIQTSKFG